MSKTDFQNILDAARPFIERMLLEEGEFIPFGMQIEKDGRVSFVSGDIGMEHPPSKEVIGFLRRSFRELSSKQDLIAAAICFMGIVNGQDAVVLSMSHSSGEAIEVFLPYELAEGINPIYGRIFASKAEGNFLLE